MISISSLEEDTKRALKAGNKVELSTLRFLLSEIKSTAIDKRTKELPEDEIIIIIKRQIKKRNDSIEQYNKANRPELVEKESVEIKILEKYLPPQLSEEQIREIVVKTIESTGATSMAEMGKIIGAVMGQTNNRADGQTVSKIAKEELSKKAQ